MCVVSKEYLNRCNKVPNFPLLGEITREAVDSGLEGEKEVDDGNGTKYRLVGILVHSGQASGGHYYSYIRQRFANIFFVIGYLGNKKWASLFVIYRGLCVCDMYLSPH